ncbi:hypothetical protein ABIC09_004982 [Bradyrhizobium sp. S3.12.5]|uniref:hypothetical protein n=1 Tax=Bradyrhizobium sp. S3.12.5 TaxID=3156386 RepID=UPI0033927606
MDSKDISAMTEASGLTFDHNDVAHTSGKPNIQADGSRRRSHSQDDAVKRWAEQSREVTLKAPLQSLFAAFVLGIWVARRR